MLGGAGAATATATEDALNVWITTYIVFGAGFGLATAHVQHLFSEGASRDAPGNRWLWVGISCGLWPLLALTGLHNRWHAARVRARVKARARNGRA